MPRRWHGCKIEFHTMHLARPTLSKIFAETLRREGGDQAPILAWPLACGSKVADRTRALSFVGGVLTVEVPDAIWRYQLQSFIPRYLAALNQVSGQPVRDITFVLSAQRTQTTH